ncbi:MAG: DUF4118 domain-containing protein, partial [Planctomycetota bacterium]
ERLLDAGIDVWTTLEVRQLASLVDLVQQITGEPVDDTVPDVFFDSAEEVEVVDLPPEELLEARRPRAASATLPGYGEAREKAVLVALREVALRRAADRLNLREESGYDAEHARSRHWPTVERLLVCVSPSPTSARLIRTSSRMASAMHAQWIAVHVGDEDKGSPEDRQRLAGHLRLAESFGAEVVSIPGRDLAREIVDYARSRCITKIIMGKTGGRRRPFSFGRSPVDQVISASGDIDVYVIRGKGGSSPRSEPAPKRSRRLRLLGYAGASLLLAAATAVAAGFDALGLTDANLVLAYLLGVAIVAGRHGRGPAVFASFAAVILFNFFFTSPQYTLSVHDSQYLFTFAVMLGIGLLVSTLTARIRDQSLAARRRERRTEQLYRLSRELSATTGHHQIVSVAEARLNLLLPGEVSILAQGEDGSLRTSGAAAALGPDPALQSVARWVLEHGRIAGAGTEVQGTAPVLCVPLETPEGVVGVLAIRPREPGLLLLPEQRRLVEMFAAQVALALQRDRLAERVHRTLAQAEAEKLRSAVLSSVSHDFRTPLAAISGASSSLLVAGERLQPGARRELLESIYEEANRLGRLIDNLLNMTRVEAGRIQLEKDWNVAEDLVGSALTRLFGELEGRQVSTDIPCDLPLIRVDGVLLELVLINLIDNALKYSPSDSIVEIAAFVREGRVVIEVADRGPGLTQVERSRVFEKFYRGQGMSSNRARGAGLGLSICLAIARLHGGEVWAEEREGGGSRFVLALPLEDQPPAIEEDDSLAASEARP